MCTDNSYNTEVQNPPIILLHGWGMNKNIWRMLVERLPKEIQQRVRCLDLPGYGDNRQELEQYDITQLTKWLSFEIQQPSIIVGWSLGGLIAQNLAYQFPEKVDKLALVASSPKFLQSDNWPGIKPDVLTLFLSQLSKDHIKTVERFLAIQAMGSHSARQDISMLKDTVLSQAAPSEIALKKGLEILQKVDLREQLKQLSCPVFALFGRLDSLVPSAIEQKVKLLNSAVKTQCFEHCSHAPFISDQASFQQWLMGIVREYP